MANKTKNKKPTKIQKEKTPDEVFDIVTTRELTEAEKKMYRKQIELMRPTLEPSLAIMESITPFNVVQKVMDSYVQPIVEMQKQIAEIYEVQNKLITQMVIPIQRMQETIRKATFAYAHVFESINISAKFLEGLVVNISLADHIKETAKNARTIYDYDELTSQFQKQGAQLTTPLEVTNEVETKRIEYRRSRKFELKLSLFEADLVELKLQQEQIIVQNSQIQSNQEKIIAMLMDGQERKYRIEQIKPDEELLDLKIDGKPVGLKAGTNMQMLANIIFSNQKPYGEWWTFHEIQSVLSDELEDEQIITARRHLNNELEKIIKIRIGKKIIELDNLKLRINPIYI